LPNITLPDGSVKSFPGPVTVAEVAQSIGAGLARAPHYRRSDDKEHERNAADNDDLK
jgi:threonyl-tRNA synthetase